MHFISYSFSSKSSHISSFFTSNYNYYQISNSSSIFFQFQLNNLNFTTVPEIDPEIDGVWVDSTNDRAMSATSLILNLNYNINIIMRIIVPCIISRLSI